MKKAFIFFLLLFPASVVCSQDAGQQVISVPVIFHVIYSGRTHSRTDGGNTQENIETAKLLTELKEMQEDFLLLNADTAEVIAAYKGIIGNPRIRFYLADTLLQPDGEKGIIRVLSRRNKRNLSSQSRVIDPRRYLNIYVGNIGSSFVNTNPWNDRETDAVYLGFDWIGQHYRLLTHETGHWCGLFHIYGGKGSGKGGGCKTDGDDIADTPVQKKPTDMDCIKCPPAVADQHCDAGVPSNYNNFMDYSGCRKMFTAEQSRRMRENITVHRPGLLR
ncbi:M43 family zinc metalloprotease [Chitinophaga solisilvae]|uniref:M43 family zinc metalloprotease n=1 Tax=Chitinophaga solisilvae TaxID=1233460 RepID=UPI00136D6A5C|nr:M43 family zinc metalloprotease [Chitinophaga solisilvae]